MKKIYLLSILIGATSLFAQNKIQEIPILPEIGKEINQKDFNTVNVNKAFGDTLWYEDFGGGLTRNGWATGTLFPWIYTTMPPGGQYSTNVAAINSVTAANGFLSLPSGFYNTPTPPGGFQAMASSITSGPIVINSVSSVLVRWRQAQRYCCSASEQLELQVSNDGFNFVSFDAKFGRQANVFVTEDAEINISSVAANHDTIYLRFYQSASHYYWMIDDIAIVEGPRTGLSLSEYFLLDSFNQRMGFANIPCSQISTVLPGGRVENLGGFPLTNVGVKASIVYNNSTLVYADSSLKVNSLAPMQDSLLVMQTPFLAPSVKGSYTVLFKPESDSINQIPRSESLTFNVTDTIFSRDNNTPDGRIGPGSYVGGDNDGSKMGLFYDIYSPVTATSISIYIDSNAINLGAVVDVELSPFNQAGSVLNNSILPPITGSNLNYTISSSDLGSWVTFPFDSTVTLIPGRYVAIVTQELGNNNGFELMMGRDRIAEGNQPFGLDFVSVLLANDGSPVWGSIFALPMIRLNATDSSGCITVGLEKEVFSGKNVKLYPNPTNGRLNIQLENSLYVDKLDVYNITGKHVFTMAIGSETDIISIDLSERVKGLYLVRLHSKVGIITKKIILE